MDLFDYMREQNKEKESPLASRLRPTKLEEVVGQQHIIGKDKLLYRAIKADKLQSVIFYGPPGTGKTTLAKVIAKTTSAEFMQINATSAGKKDMEAVIEKAKPGAVCEDLYNTAIDIVTKAGFADYFMGVGQKAKFIGHGIGLEINEAPVLAPRMKQELEPGMVFALEPKIVLPGVGPLGIENSWVVTADGVEKLTLCKEEIIEM